MQTTSTLRAHNFKGINNGTVGMYKIVGRLGSGKFANVELAVHRPSHGSMHGEMDKHVVAEEKKNGKRKIILVCDCLLYSFFFPIHNHCSPSRASTHYHPTFHISLSFSLSLSASVCLSVSLSLFVLPYLLY